MAGICVVEERGLPYVLREIDRHPCICVGRDKVGRETELARVLEGVVVELLLTNGGRQWQT